MVWYCVRERPSGVRSASRIGSADGGWLDTEVEIRRTCSMVSSVRVVPILSTTHTRKQEEKRRTGHDCV